MGHFSGRPGDIAAQQPKEVIPASASKPASDYSQRVVAYIHGNIPITREELGEFLIARHGTSKVELLVNRKIIEHACAQMKVSVTREEVEASLEEDLKQLAVDRATFVKQFLKQYNKTLYEWKEDVIKPKLLLTKLVQSQVKIEEVEIQRLFESQYGEKSQCRIIVWPEGEPAKVALKMYDEIRRSDDAFDKAARTQPISSLAATGGRIAPIGMGTSEQGKHIVEHMAFKLKPGEMSELFQIPGQGTAVLRCEGRVPPTYKDEADRKKLYDSVRTQMHKAMFDQKVAKAIPPMFEEMKKAANPNMVLKYGTSDIEVIKATEEELKYLKEKPPTGAPIVPLPGDGNR
jgi:hypothetical protein